LGFYNRLWGSSGHRGVITVKRGDGKVGQNVGKREMGKRKRETIFTHCGKIDRMGPPDLVIQ